MALHCAWLRVKLSGFTPCLVACGVAVAPSQVCYRGILLIKNCPPPGTYSRPMPRGPYGGPRGGGSFGGARYPCSYRRSLPYPCITFKPAHAVHREWNRRTSYITFVSALAVVSFVLQIQSVLVCQDTQIPPRDLGRHQFDPVFPTGVPRS